MKDFDNETTDDFLAMYEGLDLEVDLTDYLIQEAYLSKPHLEKRKEILWFCR